MASFDKGPLWHDGQLQQACTCDWTPQGGACRGWGGGAQSIAIIIPCHRIVGSDGSLTGYAGGLDRKQWLLEHEQRVLASKG